MLDRGEAFARCGQEDKKFLKYACGDIESSIYKWYTINKISSDSGYILLMLYKTGYSYRNGVQTIKGFFNTLRGLLGEKEAKEDEIIEDEQLSEVSAKDFVGTVCQVESTETQDFFMGRIEKYDPDEKELKISGYRMDSIPVRINYNAPVRIQIKSGGLVTLIYAAAKKQSKEFWWVTVESIEQRSEQREGFRQPLNGTSTIIRHVDGKEERISCKLIDISLTGICICCEEDLEIDERIGVQEVRLYPDAPDSYTFECEVRRAFMRGKDNKIINLGEEEPQEAEEGQEAQEIQESQDVQEENEVHKPQEKYYGCSFRHISLEDKEKLCKEIFLVQQQQRRAY